MDEHSTRPWHQALAYAVLGRRLPELGEQASPDVADLAERLAGLAAAGEIELPAPGAPGHVVPAELRAGLGAAQLAAAETSLRRALGVLAGTRTAGPARPLTARERELLADAPPHHGA